MIVNVLTPNVDLLINLNGPSIFLAGPCANAPAWHEEVVEWFKNIKSENTINIFIPKNEEFKSIEHQTNWETLCLEYAYNNGLVAFYLADAASNNPNRGYARTTRFELGEWITKYQLRDETKKNLLTIGIEDNFEGKDYIIHRIGDKYCTKVNTIDWFCTIIHVKLFQQS
jgi:hypothetical protein